MAYMTNAQFNVLDKMLTEIQANNGQVSEQTILEFSELMQTVQNDKDKAREKTRIAVAEKRKDPIEAEKHREESRARARRKAEEKKRKQMV